AIGLEDGDTVITARRTDGNREVMIATKLGMAIRFPENEVRPMGRGAAGVRGIDVDEGDEVIAADVVQEGAQILTISERGYGKRTPLDEYRLQGRAGKGIIDIKTGGRNGTVLDLRLIRERPDEVQRALAQKGGAQLIPEILAKDVERRRLIKEADDLKAQRNTASEAIGRARKAGQDASAEQARMREVGDRI